MALKITTRLLKEEAESRGWRVEVLDEQYLSVLIMHAQGMDEPITVWSDVTELATATGFMLAENKLATLKLAQQASVPVPEFITYAEPGQAVEFLKAHAPLVVKPIDANHGDGITTHVTDEHSLQKAIAKAQQEGTGVLVQKQYPGHDHRLLIVGDKLVAAATRRAPEVRGDGRHTIQQLVEQKNEHPLRGIGHDTPLTKIDLTEVATFLGIDQLKRVPDVDEVVRILGTANLSRGGEAVDVTDQIHPELSAAAIAIAKRTGLGVCGVDFLVTDCSKPLAESDAVLLEINVGPGLRMHHFPSEGTARNVAGAILDEIVQNRGRKDKA